MEIMNESFPLYFVELELGWGGGGEGEGGGGGVGGGGGGGINSLTNPEQDRARLNQSQWLLLMRAAGARNKRKSHVNERHGSIVLQQGSLLNE